VTACEKCYTSVTAKWTAPEKKNGEIKSYKINWNIEVGKVFPFKEASQSIFF
jgi:hypothetical protein